MVLKTDLSTTFTDKSCMKIAGSDMSKVASQELYQKTGVTPQDVQVVELHDCFSANELITYEALGLCPEGKAGESIDKGDFTYGGKYVVNPSGGLISKGHPLGATGLAQCAELCWQLRNMAQKRQVAGAKIALQHNLGLGGACVVALYKKYNDGKGYSRAEQTSDPSELEKFEGGQIQATAENQAPKSDSPSQGPSQGPALKSSKIFSMAGDAMKTNGSLVCQRVGSIFHFEILKSPGDTPVVYTINMKNSPGYIKEGKFDKPDATFTMTDADLVSLSEGKLNPQKAYLQGKMKIKGNISAAMKFTPDLLARPKL